jgi:protein involved in polysaccharide export with SLBB domain/LysM repeat protein
MFRSVATALALIVLPVVAEAQSDLHRVERGETLWAIARRYYDAPTRWPEIYDANRGVVENPHLIFPGEELVIPGVTTTASADASPARAAAPSAPSVAPPPPNNPAPASTEVSPHPGVMDRPDTVDSVAPARVVPIQPEPSPAVEPPTSHAPPADTRTGSTTPADSRPVRAPDEVDYGVRPGDEIETSFYTALGEPLATAQGNRLVDREGNLFFPFVGSVRVEGMDASEIRTVLTERFAIYYRTPVITVNVKLKVNVTGIVTHPGQFLLDPTATVVDALAQAGGTGLEFTIANNAAADLEHVQLIRDGGTIFLDVRPQAVSPTTLSMHVQSGDWIHVPPRVRSRLRDDITFWGGLLSLVTSVAAAASIISR